MCGLEKPAGHPVLSRKCQGQNGKRQFSSECARLIGSYRSFPCVTPISKRDQYSPHMIGTTGNEAWSNGEWSLTLQGQNDGPYHLKGYWSSVDVREGDAWKDRMQIWNITPAPPAETK
jgi:hypothetical protein